MPIKIEKAARRRAEKLFQMGKLKVKKGETREEAINAYVYGTLRKTGWKPNK
jgi:hypothetical protein